MLLNKEQEEAVLDNSHNLKIIAGAGTGKTRVITQKIIYLCKDLDYKLERILAITFTNKAAKEMFERIYQEIPMKKKDTNISTFHSFCLKILQNDIEKITHQVGRFNIIDEEDKRTYIKTFLKENKINYSKGFVRHIIRIISLWKNQYFESLDCQDYLDNLQDPEESLNLKIEKDVFAFYQKSLRKNNQFDYDDILIYAYHLLRMKEVKEKWQQKFDYLFVDEFQDVDLVQYHILKELYCEKQKIVVVGDPDQNIYSWRLASVQYILNFEKDFPNVKSIILNLNYRSTPEILTLANELIKNNHQRVKKELIPIKKSGSLPEIFENEIVDAESKQIVKKIKSLKEDNIVSNFKDIMVLYRNNSIAMQLENELVKAQIPYKIEKGVRFFERKEIKRMVNLLRIFTTNDDFSLINFLATLKGIGEATIKKLNAAATNEKSSVMEIAFSDNLSVLIPKLPKEIFEYLDILKITFIEIDSFDDPVIFLENLVKKFEIFKEYKENYEEKRIDNIRALYDMMISFWSLNPELNGTELLYQFLQELSLIQEESDLINENQQVDSISLSTIHKAKGLEAKVVFLIGLENGVLPFSERKSIDEIEEERRVFFVGLTRAKDFLFITFNTGFSFIVNDNLQESRFIKELSSENYKRIGGSHPNQNSEIVDNNVKDENTPEKNNLIKHLIFGIGKIEKIEDSKMEVNFDGKIKMIYLKSPLWKKVRN